MENWPPPESGLPRSREAAPAPWPGITQPAALTALWQGRTARWVLLQLSPKVRFSCLVKVKMSKATGEIEEPAPPSWS